MMQVPPGFRPSKSAPCSPAKPLGVSRTRSESFHVAHKVPVGDTPYVRAKHVQLVDKDPEKAIPLFWAAINAGDRVDSALKDMAIVMKQQNRAEEAIEAIKSLRTRCSDQAQESLDNILLDLYKRCGRLDDQISLLRHKLFLIQQGLAFNGKRTKTARSQGKKFQVSVEQEATRLLGNLGWALMQHNNYVEAEDAYRRALSISPDNNKMCNLGICLMKQGRIQEAKETLRRVKPAVIDGPRGVDSHLKAYERAQQMLQDLESERMKTAAGREPSALEQIRLFDAFLGNSSIWQPQPCRDSSNHSSGNNLPSSNNNNRRGDDFADENAKPTNQIVVGLQKKLGGGSILGSAAAAGGGGGLVGINNSNNTNSLNIDAPPFYSTKLPKDGGGGRGSDGTTSEGCQNQNQLTETLKRTRSGNLEGGHLLLQQKEEKAAGNDENQGKGGGCYDERGNKLRRRSLSFDESSMVDMLPDDKDFEEAIISAVLLSASKDAAEKKGIIKTKDGYGRRLRVFQDLTLSLSPSPRA